MDGKVQPQAPCLRRDGADWRGYLSQSWAGAAPTTHVVVLRAAELVAARSILRRRDKAPAPKRQRRRVQHMAEFGGRRFRADSTYADSPGGEEWTLSAGESRCCSFAAAQPHPDREQLRGDCA
jgi:hypothetical protein